MPPCHSQGTGAEAAASQGPLSLMAGCNCRSACNSAAVPRLGLQNTLLSPVLRNTQCVRTRAGGLSRGSSGARGRAGTAACGLYRSGSRVEQPCMPPLLPCTPVLRRAAACSLPRGDQAAGDTDPIPRRPQLPSPAAGGLLTPTNLHLLSFCRLLKAKHAGEHCPDPDLIPQASPSAHCPPPTLGNRVGTARGAVSFPALHLTPA